MPTLVKRGRLTVKKIKRIWFNYNEWEDWKGGFYSKAKIKNEIIATRNVLELFKNDDLFFRSACEMLDNWYYCTNYNLTNIATNRKSYIGQSTACYLYGYGSYFTSKVFVTLPKSVQNRANEVAIKIIKIYEEKYYDENHKNIVRGKNEKLS